MMADNTANAASTIEIETNLTPILETTVQLEMDIGEVSVLINGDPDGLIVTSVA